MSFTRLRFAPHRVDFGREFTSDELERLAEDSSVRVLQTREPLPAETWKLMNSSFFSRRPDVELRVYSSPVGLVWDLGFASLMTNVRRFAAEALERAENVERVGDILELESLSLGVASLGSFDVLRLVNPGLRSLSLGKTRSKAPDLSPVLRFQDLRKIFIDGHNKNIGVLSNLSALEQVAFHSIVSPDLRYLAGLRRLWSLKVTLGRIPDMSAIAEMHALKFLQLRQVLDLTDVRPIGELAGLQNLHLDTLSKVEALPGLQGAANLRRVELTAMKGLKDLGPLAQAPALEELILIKLRHMRP
jgi:hypothetical protein